MLLNAVAGVSSMAATGAITTASAGLSGCLDRFIVPMRMGALSATYFSNCALLPHCSAKMALSSSVC